MDLFKMLRDKLFGAKKGEQLYRQGQRVVATPIVRDALQQAGVPVSFEGAVGMLAQLASTKNAASPVIVEAVSAYVLAHGS